MSAPTPAAVNADYLGQSGRHLTMDQIAEKWGISVERVAELVAQDREDRARDGVLPGMETA